MTTAITVDTDHGGRWTSLRSSAREWLWQHRDPAIQAARTRVRPGADFVDAGGVEECFPTVRGNPDHGAAWSAPWSRIAEDSSTQLDRCALDDTTVQRMITEESMQTRIDYRIVGTPGQRFVHAVHALLDLSDDARVETPGRPSMRVLDHPRVTTATWPDVDGVDVSSLTPLDHTAYAMIIDCSEVLVTDGPDRLRLRWQVLGSEAPTSLLYWRNLAGWPSEAPYRSIGIEPLIGATADSAKEPNLAAQLDRTGVLRWRLELSSD